MSWQTAAKGWAVFIGELALIGVVVYVMVTYYAY